LNPVILVVFAVLLLWSLYNDRARRATCGYCGEQWGHDVHCPYKDVA
jgi:hypothetical protein